MLARLARSLASTPKADLQGTCRPFLLSYLHVRPIRNNTIHGGLCRAIRLGYHAAPTTSIQCCTAQDILAARTAEDGRRELVMLHWGLIPFWAKEPKTGYSMINARAETVATKPAFRRAFKSQRCLIVADGFYEWKKTKNGKQLYYIFLRNHALFAFAGLWEHWEGEGLGAGRLMHHYRHRGQRALKPIHDHMPVILSPDHYNDWLNPDVSDKARLQNMLVPYPEDEMDMYPVSKFVNNARNDDKRCIERLS